MMQAERGGKPPPSGGALVVGITGGIASGKSTVARELRRLGAHLIDADRIGHEILDSSPTVRQAVRDVFGDSVFGGDGMVDRRVLGERVFDDREALEALNNAVHPHLVAEIQSRVREAQARPEIRVIVIDAALLVEWNSDPWVQYLVVVETSLDEQISRLQARDGLSRRAALQRVTAQTSPEIRAEAADETVVNRGKLEDLIDEAHSLWRRLERMAAERAAGGQTGTKEA